MTSFEETVIRTWGEKGKAWLNDLPVIKAKLSNDWALSSLKPISNMSYHYVALALRKQNEPVVLKVGCDSEVILAEYRALQNFNGQGAVKVLDVNKQCHALLLEQAIPGTLLSHLKIEDAIPIYTDVIRLLLRNQTAPKNVVQVDSWCEALDRIQASCFKKHLVKKSLELRSFLLNSAEQRYFCHGDLHLDNIIQHGKHWLAIDPKGIVGEISFEAAAFNFLSRDDMCDPDKARQKMKARVEWVSERLSQNPDRVFAWIFLRLMISAQWFVEDQGDSTEKLQLAELVYPLVSRV